MARPKGSPPQLRFDTDRVGGQAHWVPVWCAAHHFQNRERGYIRCPHGCPPGPTIRTLWAKSFEILAGGSRGGMKGQPLSAKVMTPFGWSKMGDLKVGSQVSNPDGTVARVIQINPLGVKKLFKFEFSDGASTLVTEDHLWLAKKTCNPMKADRRYAPFDEKSQVKYKVFTTGDIRYYMESQSNKTWESYRSNFLIPLTKPVEFTSAQANGPLPVEPYFLGLLLGDGTLTSKMIRFTTADEDMAGQLILSGYNFRQDDKEGRPYDWRLQNPTELIGVLTKLGVYGKTAEYKFIPDRYKFGNINCRTEILKGLMDTDGTVDSRGHCSFSSASKRLSEDVQFIARSLGFKATLTTGPSGYRDKEGEFIQCLDSHMVYIQGEDLQSLFRLMRKRKRCTYKFNGGVSQPHRRIISVTEAGEEESQCIAVDHPNQLYITDDFIVTHNSETGRGFLLKGNLDEISVHPGGEHVMHGSGDEAYCGICTNISYITNPRYKVLVLRENEKDLADWLSRARLLYGPMGANVTEKPARVTWPSGAQFILGHMKDESSYTDYMGQEFQRILFEELTHIADETLYEKITLSCRSTFKCFSGCERGKCTCGVMREQILSTTNPLGKGHLWVKKRFISVAPANTEYTDPKTGLTRIYIPSVVTDNPYLMRDQQYVNQLNSLQEPLRSAWLLGDWDAIGGQYFRDFRPKGPLAGDPPGDVARHVIPAYSRFLAPYYPRWIGGDWGYDHSFAFYWSCRSQNGQNIVYREFVGKETSSFEAGATIAKLSFPELRDMEKAGVNPHLMLWLSPDAFSRDADENTIAAHLARGINSVLGEGAAYIPEFWDSKNESVLNTLSIEKDWGPQDVKRARSQREFGITIEKARNDRVLGWQHIRELMRFRQHSQPSLETYDKEYAFELLHNNVNLYREYVNSFEARKPEVLPKLLIYDCCKSIIEAIPTATFKEGTEDIQKVPTFEDDCLDGLRYCLYSEVDTEENREPEKSFVHRQLEKALENHPDMEFNDKVWIARLAEEKYKNESERSRPFNIRPESSRFYKRGKVRLN